MMTLLLKFSLMLIRQVLIIEKSEMTICFIVSDGAFTVGVYSFDVELSVPYLIIFPLI